MIGKNRCGNWQDLVNTDPTLFTSHRTGLSLKKGKRRNISRIQAYPERKKKKKSKIFKDLRITVKWGRRNYW